MCPLSFKNRYLRRKRIQKKMKYIVSRYEHDLSWIKDYTDDIVLYDRSKEPLPNSIVVPNLGSDIADKFQFIIDNYDNLPDVAIYTKANLFKYVSKEEFDKVKDNKTFTPLLTQNHKTYSDEQGVVCFYKDGIYYERNNLWYLNAHPTRLPPTWLMQELKIDPKYNEMRYVPFAPGSNYILPKENILKHPKKFYEKLRGYLEWSVYPGEAMIIERGLYTLWK